MRREELFDLTWENTYLDKRRIYVRKAKKGPRMIVMTAGAYTSLSILRRRLVEDGAKYNYAVKDTDFILYPMLIGINKKGQRKAIERFEDELWEVRNNAGLYDPDPQTRKDRWTFHVLRHEAESRFKECLWPHEVDRQMGHKDKKVMGQRYETYTDDDDNLKMIQKKLDAHLETQVKEIESQLGSKEFRQEVMDTFSVDERKRMMRDIIADVCRRTGIRHPDLQHPLTDLMPDDERMLALAREMGKKIAEAMEAEKRQGNK